MLNSCASFTYFSSNSKSLSNGGDSEIIKERRHSHEQMAADQPKKESRRMRNDRKKKVAFTKFLQLDMHISSQEGKSKKLEIGFEKKILASLKTDYDYRVRPRGLNVSWEGRWHRITDP